MTRKTALLLFSTLFLLLLATGSLAVGCQDGQIKRNVCDADFTARAASYSDGLTSYYQVVIPSTGSDARRFPAALYFFSSGQDATANVLLTAQLQYGGIGAKDAVYLAWIETVYADHLSGDNAATLTAALDSFTPSSQSESEYFLSLVKQGLLGDDSTLTQYLENKGANGWSSEENPAALADVAVGLSALLAHSSNPTIQQLAEMNLDIIFARFASQDAAGVFAGVSVGDSDATNVLNPAATPWYGWSGLLFSTEDTALGTALREPALLLSGYCANSVLRNIRAGSEVHTRLLQQSLGGALVSGLSDQGTVFAGGVELSGNNLSTEEGDVTRATLRSLADPLGFVLFSTATSATSTPSATGAVTAYPIDGEHAPYLLLGRLGGDACNEPHLVLGDVPYNTSRGVTVIKLNNAYYAFRFLGGQYAAPMDERYAPFSTAAAEELPHGGTVLFPVDPSLGGVFSFEEILPGIVSFVQQQSGNSALLHTLAQYVAAHTKLSADDALTYTSTLHAEEWTTYHYFPGATLTVDDKAIAPSPDDFPFRGVTEAGSSLIVHEGAWSVVYGDTSFTLDFATPKKTAPAEVYACPGTVAPGDESGDSGTLGPGDRLAFLAGALRDDGNEYTLSCGPVDEVLPNAPAFSDDELQGACVMVEGTTRAIGVLYNTQPSSGNPLHDLFASMNTYEPFLDWHVAEDFCDDELNTLPTEQYGFVTCPEIVRNSMTYYVYVSPDAGAVIFRNVENPLGDNLLGAIWNWFHNLFSSQEQPLGTTENLLSFDRAFFSQMGGKSIVAREGEYQARLDYENLSFSVASLTTFFGSYAQYGADTFTQTIMTPHFTSPAAWRAATSGLRLDLSGAPYDFGSRCAVTGTACATLPAGTIVATCDDGIHDITCNEDCTLNQSACNQTYYYDADGDGFGNVTQNQTGSVSPGDEWVLNGLDCDDSDPTIYKDCGASPSPQELICDQPLPGCDAVCNLTLPPPEPSFGDCPTEWVVALHLGEYTLSTRINEEGKPELKIHASAEKINGHTHRCNWGGSGLAKNDKVVSWTGSPGERTRIFNFVTAEGHYARVKTIESGMGWKIQFNTNVNGWASDCWGVEDVSDDPMVIGNVLPEAQDLCLQYLCIIDDPACTYDVSTGSGTSCGSDDDCYTGSVCSDGDCVLQDCQRDSDCEVGTSCLNGVCGNVGSGGGCFDPATPILFADGSSHPLGEVKVGDRVLGATVPGENTVDTVVEVFAHEGDFSLLRVNGDLLVTPIHRVLTGRGWLSVADLVVGDTLVAPDGSPVPVTSIVPAGSAPAVYNLETLPTHTYYAGGVLVHNVKDDGSGPDPSEQ